MKTLGFVPILAIVAIFTCITLVVIRNNHEARTYEKTLAAAASAKQDAQQAAAISNRTAESLSATPHVSAPSVDKIEPRSIMRIHFPREKELEMGARSLHLGRYPTEAETKEAQTSFSAYITKCVTSPMTSDWAWWCHMDLLKRTKIEKDHGQWQLYLEQVTVPEGMNLCAFLWVSPEMMEFPWARLPNNTCVFR